MELSQPQLRALLALMPQLHTLTLQLMHNLCDFAPLLRVQATLRKLIIHNCTHEGLTPVELLQLQGLELHSLWLCHSLCELLDEQQLADLQPPSWLLPTLQDFKYAPPWLDW